MATIAKAAARGGLERSNIRTSVSLNGASRVSPGLQIPRISARDARKNLEPFSLNAKLTRVNKRTFASPSLSGPLGGLHAKRARSAAYDEAQPVRNPGRRLN